MKIVYFLKNGIARSEDLVKREEFRKQGHKIVFSNADVLKGFESVCDAVYLNCDAAHVEKWAKASGIDVMKPQVANESEHDSGDEEQAKPRRGRKPAAEE